MGVPKEVPLDYGITVTPLHLIGKFASFGIRKRNVGTQRADGTAKIVAGALAGASGQR
jgi:hypothetical protein